MDQKTKNNGCIIAADGADNATVPTRQNRARWIVPGVCVFLALAVLLVFERTASFEFINYDDNLYVYNNVFVRQGLTLESVAAAFSHKQLLDWIPLTALSHMLGWQLFGSWAGGHHLVNVLLHAASSILLFLVLLRLTGSLWRCAFVATIFAIHPLHVESVAWVSERKDVLSGLFFMFTLGAYTRYARSPSLPRYAEVMVFLAMGLLCKAMLVTVPFLLLLLDHWPLGRTTHTRFTRLFIEKLPLILMCAAVIFINVYVNETAVTLAGTQPLTLRLENGVVSYAAYLGQMFWPANLSVFYTMPKQGINSSTLILAAVVLLAISALVFFWRRVQPWLPVGWLWFLGMLVPVIGLMPPGEFSRADRYTYLPQIGLYIAIAWTAWSACASLRCCRVILGVVAVTVITALMVCARIQVSHWHDSASLWTHALDCTTDNNVAHNNLGAILLDAGRMDEAAIHFQKALDIQPGHTQARNNLGAVLFHKGRVDDAIAHYLRVLEIDPRSHEAYNNLGSGLLQKNRAADAVAAYQRALELQPGSPDILSNLGNALLQLGRLDEAIKHFEQTLVVQPNHVQGHLNLASALMRTNQIQGAALHYQKALDLRPDNPEALSNLATAFFLLGRVKEAVTDWQRALLIQPANVSTLNNLAWVLATGPALVRDGARSVELAQEGNRLTSGASAVMLRTLAAAYAESGRFPDALDAAGRALQLARDQSDTALMDKIERERKQYERGLPFHDGVSGTATCEASEKLLCGPAVQSDTLSMQDVSPFDTPQQLCNRAATNETHD